MGKRGSTHESSQKNKPLTSAFDITPRGSSFALTLDDDPTKYESGKLRKGKEVFAYESMADRFEGKAGNIRSLFIAL